MNMISNLAQLPVTSGKINTYMQLCVYLGGRSLPYLMLIFFSDFSFALKNYMNEGLKCPVFVHSLPQWVANQPGQ